MKTLSSRLLIRCIGICILFLPVLASQAKEIQLSMPNQLMGLAQYWPNDKTKPAILVLHGFLQTGEFSTIQYITDELVNNEYPVLAPTLSLNVNLRRQGLTCDSIHTHNINDNNREIQLWLEWLKQQGYQSIILIGHSSGNLQLISFLQQNRDPAIKALIAVSPGTIWNPYKQEETIADIKKATAAKNSSPKTLNKYTLGFCEENYNSTAENFLSYANWTESHLLKSFKELNLANQVIIGSSDPYIPSQWAEKLRNANIKVTIIKGANHFFSGEAEFLLQDSIIKILDNDI